MKNAVTALAGVVLAIGLAGCGASTSIEPTTRSSVASSVTSEETTMKSTSETTQPVAVDPTTKESIVEEASVHPTPVIAETHSTPQIPPFMKPEDFDPYGPLKFVECWESNAAVMSDGSIVTDTLNCAPSPSPSTAQPNSDPLRTDGCVGPAAVCGYYDEYGNPIWFDKTTGETSPRYYDEYGNPTMQRP